MKLVYSSFIFVYSMTKLNEKLQKLSTIFIAGILLGSVAVFSPIQPAYASLTEFTILDNATRGDCAGGIGPIGTWDDLENLCTLTVDLFDVHIVIGSDNVTLDCNDHEIDANGFGIDGILLDARTGVTIMNCLITGFDQGIHLNNNRSV